MRALGLLVALALLPIAALAQTAPAPAADPAPAPAPAAAGSSEAEAGDVSEVDKDRVGPLRERIRPVSGHVFLKKGRLEVSPSATISLRDAFFRKYIFGASFTYHLQETLAVGVRAGYSMPTVSSSAQICTFGGDDGSVRDCRRPDFDDDLDGKAPGQIKLLAGADVQWAPIYGKISLLAESFAHFDMYGVAGAALVQYKADTSKMTVGGNLGVGLRFFLNRSITLRTEVRDLIYQEKFQTTGASSLRNQLLFELGVSFFLFDSPTP
jgi:outer membrane beta-barrel protein